MKYAKTLATFCASALLTGTAFAGVSEQEAARLGKDLTPMGAEAAGNADGSIPAWNPAGAPIPTNFVAGSDNYVNPYPNDKPLFTVNASNWRDHSDKLTEGTKALFEKLGADGFEIKVYQSRRDSISPDWMYKNNRMNATGATLVADGQKVEGAYPGAPFPIPASGLEVLWNHLVRFGSDHTLDYATYYVGANGKPVLATIGDLTNVFPMFQTPTERSDEPWVKLRINYTAPARRAGEILLVHEPGADFTEGKGRRAWQYLTGQRRVRMAPAVSFDTPNPGVAGTSTYDDAFIFNGSPERYNWKLIGKKEMYVPYNCYDFTFQTKVEDALGPKFLDPNVIRWELHRVWIIEAELKEGARHLYQKRRYYIDEDTWSGIAGETYDGRGNLWRVHYAYPANLYDIKSRYDFAYGTYDLLQNIYNINTKPIPGKFKNGVDRGDKYFTAQGMARGGIR